MQPRAKFAYGFNLRSKVSAAHRLSGHTRKLRRRVRQHRHLGESGQEHYRAYFEDRLREIDDSHARLQTTLKAR